MKTYILTALGLSLIGVIIYCVIINNDRDSLNTELTSVQNTLSSTQTQLLSTQAQLDSKTTQLDTMLTKLAFAEAQLQPALQELDSLKLELNTTKDSLHTSQLELIQLQYNLTTTQQQLTIAQSTLGGLGITLSASMDCSDVVLVDNPNATNPTWAQLKFFLMQDQTENHIYIEGFYDCSQFSKDLHNRAESAGIRAAEVQLWFQGEPIGHALNAFLTTDFGLVYVDCTNPNDTIAYVKKGEEYRAVELNDININYVRNDSWWRSLVDYYYLPSSHIYNLWGTPAAVITSSIEIYW
ncbi:MAG: hypothetical protein WC370_02245 [Dehalococcoidales bacterium]|jgi:uncharacterized membrane-anchored protein YhcB (DUF1043 family)